MHHLKDLGAQLKERLSPSQGIPQPGQYVNPVINRDWPDPNCILVDGVYHTYATNRGTNVQHGHSSDLVNWVEDPDALPRLPEWANPGLTWAPSVTRVQAAESVYFVLYHVARDRQSNRQAVGQAISQSPDGPFEPTTEVPFLNQVWAHEHIFASACRRSPGHVLNMHHHGSTSIMA